MYIPSVDLSIVVVSYNTRQLVEDCLLSVERHLDGRVDYELIVVDNASKDGTPAWLEGFVRGRPRLLVQCLADNLGFSGGNNRGIRMARGRNVLLLNSDAYLIDDSLVAALAYLDSREDVFSLAGMLLTGDGRPGPSYGHFPTARTLARELATKSFNRLRAVCPDPAEPTHEIDFPCGAYYLIKGRLLKEIGEMDESFFMYFEETDLAKRAAVRGYKSVYFAPAKAVHLGGQSTQEVKSLHLVRMYYANWRRFLRKHGGALDQVLVRAMLGGYFTLASLAHTARGNSGVAEFFRTHGKALKEGWSAVNPAGTA